MKKDNLCRSCEWFIDANCHLEPPTFITETYSSPTYDSKGHSGYSTQYTSQWARPYVDGNHRCRHHKFSPSKFAIFIGKEMAK